MANRYRAENKRKIRYAFNRLLLNEKNTVLDGMERLAKAAMDFLVQSHESHALLMLHTTETDTLAWALAQDGRVLRSGRHDGGEHDLPGAAQKKARDIASGTHGWAVIILSDMEGWYREDLEMDFLVNTSFSVAGDFQKFFKKVKV